eukprot:IDg3452t1
MLYDIRKKNNTKYLHPSFSAMVAIHATFRNTITVTTALATMQSRATIRNLHAKSLRELCLRQPDVAKNAFVAMNYGNLATDATETPVCERPDESNTHHLQMSLAEYDTEPNIEEQSESKPMDYLDAEYTTHYINQELREFDNSSIRATYLMKEASTARPQASSLTSVRLDLLSASANYGVHYLNCTRETLR